MQNCSSSFTVLRVTSSSSFQKILQSSQTKVLSRFLEPPCLDKINGKITSPVVLLRWNLKMFQKPDAQSQWTFKKTINTLLLNLLTADGPNSFNACRISTPWTTLPKTGLHPLVPKNPSLTTSLHFEIQDCFKQNPGEWSTPALTRNNSTWTN